MQRMNNGLYLRACQPAQGGYGMQGQGGGSRAFKAATPQVPQISQRLNTRRCDLSADHDL